MIDENYLKLGVIASAANCQKHGVSQSSAYSRAQRKRKKNLDISWFINSSQYKYWIGLVAV